MKDSITPSTNPSERTCPRCDGYGEISPDIMCPLCEGYGTIEQLPDATPSKEAKHTETFPQFFSRYNEKFQLGLNDLSSEGVRTRMYKAVELYVGELAQEVEDLRKQVEKWKERELTMQENFNRERKELNELRERNRELEELLEQTVGFLPDDVGDHFTMESVDAAQKLKTKATSALSRNESKTPNEE